MEKDEPEKRDKCDESSSKNDDKTSNAPKRRHRDQRSGPSQDQEVASTTPSSSGISTIRSEIVRDEIHPEDSEDSKSGNEAEALPYTSKFTQTESESGGENSDPTASPLVKRRRKFSVPPPEEYVSTSSESTDSSSSFYDEETEEFTDDLEEESTDDGDMSDFTEQEADNPTTMPSLSTEEESSNYLSYGSADMGPPNVLPDDGDEIGEIEDIEEAEETEGADETEETGELEEVEEIDGAEEIDEVEEMEQSTSEENEN